MQRPGQTSYAQVAAFLRRFHGVEHPILLSIHNISGIAILIVALDPFATDLETIGRQVVVAEKKLWVVRPIKDPSQILYFTEALRYLGFDLPAVRFYRKRDKTYAFQEFLPHARPCFTGVELAPLASKILPAVIAASGTDLLALNLTLHKFVTLGEKKFFVGLRPHPYPVPLETLASDLSLAGLIDPQRSVEQFEKGLVALTALDSSEFETQVRQQMRTAGIPQGRIDALVAENRRNMRERVITALRRLLDRTHILPSEVEERARVREGLTVAKEALLPPEILPYVRLPEENVTERMQQEVSSMLRGKSPVSIEAVAEAIITAGKRIVRVEGSTARGKTTFLQSLAAVLTSRGKKVVPISIDAMVLKPPLQRARHKVAIAEAAGLGFVSFADEDLSFQREQTRTIIQMLNCGEGNRIKLYAQGTPAIEGCRERKEVNIDVVVDADTIFIVEGKFFCWPSYWEGISAPTCTILLYAPPGIAHQRLARRGEVGFERMQSTLLDAWYDPSFYHYLQESGLLQQVETS
jgi:hypothetical protein